MFRRIAFITTLTMAAFAALVSVTSSPIQEPASQTPIQVSTVRPYSDQYDVIEPPKLGKYVVCVENARVYSNPGENENWYMYSLPSGTQVRPREFDRRTRTWVSVEVARWVKMTDLCRLEQ
jgi:hypothetical protein